MGIGETHYYWIFCDHKGCNENTDGGSMTGADSERVAENRALADGWTQDDDGNWLCPDHSKKPDARKGRR